MPRLRALVRDQDTGLRAITTPAAAQAAGFLGSPTVRVDGIDVEPTAGDRTDFDLKRRLYATADGLRHTPDDATLLAALA